MSLLEPAQPIHRPLVYPPLDPSKDEIRLINLLPPLKDDSSLRCTFSHTSLLSDTGVAKPPSYETLSYVWGEPDFSASVIVNDQHLHVTHNLKSILSSLRHKEMPRLLWIDAICINQQDLDERAQQVKLMRKVYSSCRRVLACVGPRQTTICGVPFEYSNVESGDWHMQGKQLRLEEGEVERLKEQQRYFNTQQREVVAAMEALRKIVVRDSHTLRTLEENYARTQQEKYSSHDAQPAATGEMLLDLEGNALMSLLICPAFWSRVWVVQEISCAPQVTLLCGRTELEWAYISEFLKDEPYFDAFHATETSHGFRYRNKENFRRIFTNAKIIEDQRRTMCDPTIKTANTLLDVLTRFRNKQAADPRDKIYALLGLVNQKHGINVDYTKPLQQLYQEVTLALIRISGNLDIVCQNPFEFSRGLKHLRESQKRSIATPHGYHETIPSWAAEFHLQRNDCFPVMFAQRDIFNAGLKTENVVYRVVGSGSNVLALQGTVVDRIGSTFPDWRSGMFSRSDDLTKQDRSRVGAVLQHTSLRDGRHGYSATHILRSIFKDGAANTPLAGGNAVKSLGDPESPTRAFWRTLVRDCAAPPRMRRLTTEEIEELDLINTSAVKAGEMPRTCEANAPSTELTPIDLPWEDEENYVFAVSSNGLYLLTRRFTEEGDVIAVLDGGRVPVVLRSVKGGDVDFEHKYEFVCVAYVHGIMDGEINEAVADGWLQKEEILLA